MDRVVVVLGVADDRAHDATSRSPPARPSARRCARPCCPRTVDFLAITTLIGGTVGGYIVYAGAHRLLDSGVTGPEHVRDITRGSVTGILSPA